MSREKSREKSTRPQHKRRPAGCSVRCWQLIEYICAIPHEDRLAHLLAKCSRVGSLHRKMGKGSKGGKKQAEAPKVEEAKSKPDAAEAEAGFMKALQREMGDVEITEASVREYIAKMTPEQRLRLQNEGKDLKQELLTNTDHKEELQVFRKEVNAKAEAAGLPVEKVPPPPSPPPPSPPPSPPPPSPTPSPPASSPPPSPQPEACELLKTHTAHTATRQGRRAPGKEAANPHPNP